MGARKIDYGGLDKVYETGVRALPGKLDQTLNETCPDWCTLIFQHEIDYTGNAPRHESRRLFVKQLGLRGYDHLGSEDSFAAHLELALVRHLEQPARISIIQVYGDEDFTETVRQMGTISLNEARDLMAVLAKLVEVAEDDEGLE